MKEDIIAANLSSLRADIQALPQKIAEELNQNATEQSDSSLQIDETKVATRPCLTQRHTRSRVCKHP